MVSIWDWRRASGSALFAGLPLPGAAGAGAVAGEHLGGGPAVEFHQVPFGAAAVEPGVAEVVPEPVRVGGHAACAPWPGSPPGSAATLRSPRRLRRRRRRRWPAGSSPRPATSPATTAPRSRRSPAAAPSSKPLATWSASSRTCSATAAANARKPGPARPRTARSPSCAASPEGSAPTAAVTAGLTVSYSSGAVEGHVNRIKMIKDRCTDALNPTCKRVLLAD
jgi:hypothetical protein